MRLKSIIGNKSQASLGVFIVTFLFILWEHFNGGVVTHHLLARDDLPGLSNWWGLVTVPLLYLISISLINRRSDKLVNSKTKSEEFENKIFKRFLAGLGFGLLLSILWEFQFESILQYLILIPILVAFFRPVHLPEYLMGFVLGMLFTFGGILPIMFGVILSFLCFLINSIMKVLRNLISIKAD
jgi:hypothetical protein